MRLIVWQKIWDVLQLDEPLADPAALNDLFRVKPKMIQSLLSGTGGDDVFTGYRRYTAAMEKYWAPQSVKKQLNLAKQTNVHFRRLAKPFRGINLSGDNRLINFFRWRYFRFRCFANPEFKESISKEC